VKTCALRQLPGQFFEGPKTILQPIFQTTHSKACFAGGHLFAISFTLENLLNRRSKKCCQNFDNLLSPSQFKEHRTAESVFRRCDNWKEHKVPKC
jgi:hypothetical protein